MMDDCEAKAAPVPSRRIKGEHSSSGKYIIDDCEAQAVPPPPSRPGSCSGRPKIFPDTTSGTQKLYPDLDNLMEKETSNYSKECSGTTVIGGIVGNRCYCVADGRGSIKREIESETRPEFQFMGVRYPTTSTEDMKFSETATGTNTKLKVIGSDFIAMMSGKHIVGEYFTQQINDKVTKGVNLMQAMEDTTSKYFEIWTSQPNYDIKKDKFPVCLGFLGFMNGRPKIIKLGFENAYIECNGYDKEGNIGADFLVLGSGRAKAVDYLNMNMHRFFEPEVHDDLSFDELVFQVLYEAIAVAALGDTSTGGYIMKGSVFQPNDARISLERTYVFNVILQQWPHVSEYLSEKIYITTLHISPNANTLHQLVNLFDMHLMGSDKLNLLGIRETRVGKSMKILWSLSFPLREMYEDAVHDLQNDITFENLFSDFQGTFGIEDDDSLVLYLDARIPLNDFMTGFDIVKERRY